MNNTDFNRINICLFCDENYAQHAGVAIASILANAKTEDNIFIYILDGNISEESKNKILSLKSIKDCSIEFVKVDEKEFEDYKKISTHNYITIPTYYRLKLSTLLLQVDKIIYLDCDVVVCNSLRELYNIDLGENIFGGVLDIDIPKRNNPKYVNAGVLLMDLDKVRHQNIENQFLEYTRYNRENIHLGDQEIINDVLKGKILNIDEKYNVQSMDYIKRSTFTKAPAIIHFICRKKPWSYGSWSVHKGLYFKYLQMTPWKLSNRELFKWTTLNEFSSFISWFKNKPFFYLRPKFWNAVRQERLFQKFFSVKNVHDRNITRKVITILGIKFKFKKKIKFPKNAISTQKIISNPENIEYRNKTAVIFAMFNKDSILLENTITYLHELRKYSDFIVVVSDCPMLKTEIDKLSPVANAYIIKRHNEYDFGSYKRGFLFLKNLNVLQNVDNLILCNDSIVYNTNVSIKPLIEGAKSKDFYGLTINKNGYSKNLVYGEDIPHIQSYFLSISKNIFSKKFFLKFIKSIKKENKKGRIIYKYEQGLSRVITANGFEMNSFYPIRENNSAYLDPTCYYLNNNNNYNGERIFLKKYLLESENK